MEELERVLARKKMEEEIKKREKQRQEELISRLQQKKALEAQQKYDVVDFNIHQKLYNGPSKVSTSQPLAATGSVDMAGFMAQQLKMMQDMTNSFMNSITQREAERKKVEDKIEMREMKSSIKSMEQMLLAGQMNSFPPKSTTLTRFSSHVSRAKRSLPVKDRLTLPMYNNFTNSSLVNNNGREPASKRSKNGNRDDNKLPDDLVLTEITRDGPKAVRKKIFWTKDD